MAGKRKDWEKWPGRPTVATVNIEDTLFLRQETWARTQYTAPKQDQKWRARDLVDIHWELVGVPTPSPSYNRIMSCIIGHANPTSGRCETKLIAAETGYCVKTVSRAIDWWVAHGFLIEDIGLAKSRAYRPQWDLFELHWIAIAEDIKARKQASSDGHPRQRLW